MLTTTFLQPSFNASVVYFYTWPSLAPPRWILLSHLSNNVTIQLTGFLQRVPQWLSQDLISHRYITQPLISQNLHPQIYSPPPTLLQDNAEIASSQITSSKATYMAKASCLQP